MIDLAGGDASRLRPHMKTHKMGEAIALQVAAGITKVKAATIAEAELAAAFGSTDILLAYPLVGPNIVRFLDLMQAWPDKAFSALADDPRAALTAARIAAGRGQTLSLWIDLDCGMGRTGIVPGEEAVSLCRLLATTPGLRFAGIHAYDGHIHDTDPAIRESRFNGIAGLIQEFQARLLEAGVDAGSGGGWFSHLPPPCQQRCLGMQSGNDPSWDSGYGLEFPDLAFLPAAALLTRVVSKPGNGRLTLDLGHKAVAAEQPLGRRVRFPALMDADFVMQSEEHLVISTDHATSFEVGDVLIGVPWHVCPTVALHMEAVLIRDGRSTGETWRIAARDRRITI
ncbi:MAG: alanine racemase [Verrucomicrobiales bacterium]